MSARSVGTHDDACLLELLADRAPGNAQLGTDLAKRPTPGVRVGCTLNVHGATVATPDSPQGRKRPDQCSQHRRGLGNPIPLPEQLVYEPRTAGVNLSVLGRPPDGPAV
jgi:hypothetical protein